MRKPVLLFISILLAAVAGQASAKTLDWHGTLEIELGTLPQVKLQGAGVATVNNSTGGTHLNFMRLQGGITGSGLIPVTDPETTGTIPSIRVSATLGSGTLSGISGAPPLGAKNTLPVPGFTRVCLLDTSCVAYLPLNHTTNNGATGLGIGGLLTLGKFKSVRISVINGPWTLATGTGSIQTHEGGFRTVSKGGFVHGANSNNSTTATGSGVIQLIAPQQVFTSGVAGNSTALSLFTTLTLHFIPEPGLLLLIGSGVVGLGLLGRSRVKK